MATLESIESTDNDEDSGFLKIANVVSLAPKESDNQIVSIGWSLFNPFQALLIKQFWTIHF